MASENRRPGSSPRLGAVVDEIVPGAVNTYREPSFFQRETIPPAHEDGPPNVRPRTKTQTGMPAPPSERKPPVSNPPPPELEPQHRRTVVIEEDDRPSVVDFRSEVRMGYGKAAFVGPAWLLIVVLVLGLLGANLYFSVRHSDATPANCATKDEVRAVDAKVDSLRGDVANLVTKVMTESERTHNDMELLKLKVDVDSQRSK